MQGQAFGGIGAAADETIEQEPVAPPADTIADRRVPRRPDPPHDIIDSMDRLNALIAGLTASCAGFGERLDNAEKTSVQHDGQLASIEVRLQQIGGYLGQLDASMKELAKRVMRDVRYGALELAIRSRGPGEQADRVVANAERYVKFLDQNPEDGTAPGAVSGPN